MLRILIVEDDALLAEYVATQLGAAGYETVTCLDGAAAWERLQADPRCSFSMVKADCRGAGSAPGPC